MTDFLPLIAAVTTPGFAQFRRVTTAEREAYTRTLLGWLPDFSILGRAGGQAVGITLPSGTVFGRTASGTFGPLGAADLDVILDLVSRLALKANVVHGHGIADVTALQEALDAKAAIVHGHDFQEGAQDVDWTTLADGRILSRQGGEFVWIPLPVGGGGIDNPLTGPLDLAGYALTDGTDELLRYDAGTLYLQGAPAPRLPVGNPSAGHVWIFKATAWEHRALAGVDIPLVIPNVVATDLQGVLEEHQTALENRAALLHLHRWGDLRHQGEALGKVLVGNAEFGFDAVDLPSGGGSVNNPLTANLDIAAFALVSGVTEILRVTGGAIQIGGRTIFPSSISNPQDNDLAIYNAVSGEFENGPLSAAIVIGPELGAEYGVAGTPVASQLTAIASSLDVVKAQTTDAVAEGTTNLFATTASVTAAGAVMVSDLVDLDALSNDTDKAPTSRAVKAHVAAAVAGADAGSSFPVSPTNGDRFYRTDLAESFVYLTGYGPDTLNVWLSESERSIVERVSGSGLGTGAGEYILGTGSGNGPWIGSEAIVTTFALVNPNSDSGTAELRRAPQDGAVTAIGTLTFTSSKRESVAVDRRLLSTELLSVHASSFSGGLANPHILIGYRAAFVI